LDTDGCYYVNSVSHRGTEPTKVIAMQFFRPAYAKATAWHGRITGFQG